MVSFSPHWRWLWIISPTPASGAHIPSIFKKERNRPKGSTFSASATVFVVVSKQHRYFALSFKLNEPWIFPSRSHYPSEDHLSVQRYYLEFLLSCTSSRNFYIAIRSLINAPLWFYFIFQSEFLSCCHMLHSSEQIIYLRRAYSVSEAYLFMRWLIQFLWCLIFLTLLCAHNISIVPYTVRFIWAVYIFDIYMVISYRQLLSFLKSLLCQ